MDAASNPAGTPSADAIAEWIAAWLARELPMPIDEIDRDESLDSYGVSSLLIVTMSGELEDLLGYPVDPSIVYDYPTINELAAHFASGQGAEP
jgi:acyl carrier protein